MLKNWNDARADYRDSVVRFHKFKVAGWWTVAQKHIIIVSALGKT
jgi:hypothetical protein